MHQSGQEHSRLHVRLLILFQRSIICFYNSKSRINLASSSGASGANQKQCLDDYINGGGDAGREIEIGGNPLPVSVIAFNLCKKTTKTKQNITNKLKTLITFTKMFYVVSFYS